MLRPVPMPMADRAAALPPLTLVLGGARSGKSAYAESLVDGQGEPFYLATAQARDGEMIERIRRHQARRPAPWRTIEEPIHLVAALTAQAQPGRVLLVDCLTLWLTNIMLADGVVEREIDHLLHSLPGLACPVVMVSNEVGLGIVPENPLARAFRDHAGRLNQSVAARCQRVMFVAAGLPLLLKDVRTGA